MPWTGSLPLAVAWLLNLLIFSLKSALVFCQCSLYSLGLPPEVVEKYNAAAGSNSKKFELLKEFLLSDEMTLGCTSF